LFSLDSLILQLEKANKTYIIHLFSNYKIKKHLNQIFLIIFLHNILLGAVHKRRPHKIVKNPLCSQNVRTG